MALVAPCAEGAVKAKDVPSPAFLLIAARDIKEKDNDLARMQKTGYWPADRTSGAGARRTTLGCRAATRGLWPTMYTEILEAAVAQ